MRENSAAEAKPAKWQGLNWEWPSRAAMVLEYLAHAKSVVDIGCGKMTLSRLLPPEVIYQGVDIAQRDGSTIVVDLNKERLPDLDFDAAVVLGVIEYLHDPAALFDRLQQFETVIISYNCHGLKDYLDKVGIHRQIPKAWVVRLKHGEIIDLFARFGFEIIVEKKVRWSEYVFVARRKSSAINKAV